MVSDTTIDIINHISRLRWACRRGMLELDVILNNFLDEAYPPLATKEKEGFVKMLACSDPELFSWLVGEAVPEDMDLTSIVLMVRAHAQSRF